MTRKKTLHTSLTVLLLIVAGEILNFIFGPFGVENQIKDTMSYLFLTLTGIHFVWAMALLFITIKPTTEATSGTEEEPEGTFASKSKSPFLTTKLPKRKNILLFVYRIPEVLFVISGILFLFSFIYALNANMDYAQRFAESSGNIQLAPDSTIQRLNSFSRFLPYLLFDSFVLIYWRIKSRSLMKKAIGTSHLAAVWGLPLTLFSAFLYTAALPSFVVSEGLFPLAFICLIPLILVFRYSPYKWAVFYGIVFGVFQTMLSNFWLGTFSLISLQFITVYYLFLYTLFMLFTVWIIKFNWRFMFMTLPALWVVFDYLRSIGFMGYPWAMLGSSQYQFLPFIQISALTGIWGVTFLVILANTVITEIILTLNEKKNFRRTPLLLFVVLYGFVIIYGEMALHLEENRTPEKSVRFALIQQNTDPRKDDYRESFDNLTFLTNKALDNSQSPSWGTEEEFGRRPDLIAWSETAFVPNIRKWSKKEPTYNSYTRLVHDFLKYQKTIGTWLITGNDDYMEKEIDGETQRVDYNAAILFSPTGERVETYHKIHLVPFTEYFPFKKQFPNLYNMLLSFDVNFWEPGTEPTVFNHPLVKFSTPICFEDSFPSDVRRFVNEGADLILNLSNDFWSLTEVEAKQHFANSLFRAIENRRPLLRSTASGITAYVDTTGTIRAQLPTYAPGYLLVDVDVPKNRTTLYTYWGDWFPYFLMILLLIIPIFSSYSYPRDRIGNIVKKPYHKIIGHTSFKN